MNTLQIDVNWISCQNLLSLNSPFKLANYSIRLRGIRFHKPDLSLWTLNWTCFEHCERSLAAGHIMATSCCGVSAGLRSLALKIGWTMFLRFVYAHFMNLYDLYIYIHVYNYIYIIFMFSHLSWSFLRFSMFLHRAESGLHIFFAKSCKSLSASVGRRAHWLQKSKIEVCMTILMSFVDRIRDFLRLQPFENVTSDGPMRCGQSRLWLDVIRQHIFVILKHATHPWKKY